MKSFTVFVLSFLCFIGNVFAEVSDRKVWTQYSVYPRIKVDLEVEGRSANYYSDKEQFARFNATEPVLRVLSPKEDLLDRASSDDASVDGISVKSSQIEKDRNDSKSSDLKTQGLLDETGSGFRDLMAGRLERLGSFASVVSKDVLYSMRESRK